ncbi:hypothetical protein SUGI_0194710 [Cryptomeria japonica]|nr:hypothetical protein SUGI_0194710 [Cryptomeria japonica]
MAAALAQRKTVLPKSNLDKVLRLRIYAIQITDAMMTNAKYVYPDNTPPTKEAYFYRMIFERFFPQNAAHMTVPAGPSVACSTAKAIEWDVAWSNNLDPSGRAALGVHLPHNHKNNAQVKLSSDTDNFSKTNNHTGEIRQEFVRS